MKKFRWYLAVAALFAISAAAPAEATPIIINGPWLEFGFGAAGTFATGCLPVDPIGITHCFPSPSGNSELLGTPPWTFTVQAAARLTVTDAGAAGDQFEIFDNGSPVGDTSFVPNIGVTGCNDPAVCVTDPNYSHGSFILTPGSHSLMIEPIVSPFFPALGAAFFRVDSPPGPPVPEPSSLSLLAVGVVGLGLARLRRVRRARP
jgi:hypothetical protein